MSSRPEVVVYIRSGFERQHWLHPQLCMWLFSLPYEKKYKLHIEMITGASPASASANISAITFLNEHPNAEWFCLVDNDTAPPGDILRILDDLPDHVAKIGPVVHMMQGDKISPMPGTYSGPSDVAPVDISASEPMQEVDRVGGGCTFTRRHVLQAMLALDPPFFKEIYDLNTNMVETSDDVYFDNRARQMGFRLFCDTRFIASHFHTTDLSRGA